MERIDVCVIGAGPGGYVAALRAAGRGARVALVEKNRLGGTCLNIGCIPTKTLIAGCDVLRSARAAACFGVNISGEIEVDWPAMLVRKNQVVDRLRHGIAGLLKSAGVELVAGTAEFAGRTELKVTGADGERKLTAASFVVATGSVAAKPGFLPDSPRILTSTELLDLPELPASLLILGGGVIGCEFAGIFAELGVKVTIVEMMPSILPGFDADAAGILAASLKKKGVEILAGKPLANIAADSEGVEGTVDGKVVSGEYMLAAVGRAASTESLNIEAAGVETKLGGWIIVDDKCRTSAPNIYAIGDVTGDFWLAHSASAMGLVAAGNAVGGNCRFDGSLIPSGVYTHPEVAAVGLSLAECRQRDIDVNVGKFPFAALGKALAIDESEGFCRVLADAETDQVLGVQIVGPHATDLIAEAAAAMRLETTAKELGMVIHAHPTLSEALMEAAHAVHRESAHIAVRRREK